MKVLGAGVQTAIYEVLGGFLAPSISLMIALATCLQTKTNALCIQTLGICPMFRCIALKSAFCRPSQGASAGPRIILGWNYQRNLPWL